MMHAMNRSRFSGRAFIAGLFMIVMTLTGPAMAIISVDMVLTPSHSSPEFSLQPPLYNFSEPVEVNVTLTNRGSGPVTIIGYPPRSGISYRSQQDFRTFNRSGETLVLTPDQSTAFTVRWDQKDETGHQVEPGLYMIAVYFLLADNGTGSYDLSHIEPYSRSLEVMILPKTGAYQGDIIVKKSITGNNITATLESIQLSNTSGKANITIQVPEKIPYMVHHQGWIRCYADDYLPEARYSLDHTVSREFTTTSMACDPRLDPGVIHMTYLFEPVPADAKTLEINLTSTGTVPWSCTYQVNLSTRPDGEGTLLVPQSAPLHSITVILAIACIGTVTASLKRRNL